MDGVRHHTTQINGFACHYAERGSGDLVLMLHGFPEFWYAWRHQLDDLGADFHAVAPDTRGINLSGGPAEVDGYKVDALVDDVRALIRHLGHERATLVGHDWGGFIAWETAVRHPELVDRLVIVNCAHPAIFDRMLREDGHQAKASRYMLAFRSPAGEQLVSRDDFAGFRTNILDPGIAAGHLTEADAARYVEAWHRPGSVRAGLNYYGANKAGPPSGDDPPTRDLAAATVRVPTSVIWGIKDPYFDPAGLDRLPSVVPDLTVRRYPDNDHWIVHQRPHEVSALIRAFARGEPLPDSPG